MNKESPGPVLEVGQVWSLKERDIAIIGLGKHLAEYRECRDGKVLRIGLSDLKAQRAVREELVNGRAKLTGHIVIADCHLQIDGSRSKGPACSRER
jgi:hypothetical protein